MKKLILPLLLLSLATPAWAVKFVALKDKRAMLDTEGEVITVGDRFIAKDEQGKSRAIIEVKQVKNNRALSEIVRGQANMTMSLTKLGAKPTTSDSAKKEKPASRKRSQNEKGIAGFLLGYSNNSMTVKPAGAASVSLSGTSFAVSGLYQLPVDGAFGGRLLVTYENLKATGTGDGAVCTSCEVDISYLGIEALAKYSFVRNTSMEVWAGAGLGFLFAMSKSSNILDTSKISTNQTIVGALGMDYRLSPTSYIPVQFDYAMYPDNSTSSATQMILRVGYGFSY